jgi:hypothetical protein
MSMFWWLDVIPGWEWLAEFLVILWIGVSMSAVAWMKVWMSKQSFNTGSHSFISVLVAVFLMMDIACSMMAIILFIV